MTDGLDQQVAEEGRPSSGDGKISSPVMQSGGDNDSLHSSEGGSRVQSRLSGVAEDEEGDELSGDAKALKDELDKITVEMPTLIHIE